MATPSEDLKKCTSCGKRKRLSGFYARSDSFHSRYAACKTCSIAKNKARRTGPRRAVVLEMDRVSMKAKRALTKSRVFAAYGGYRCVCCGETEPLFLTLDHIKNDGGKFRKEKLGSRTKAGCHTYRWLEKNNFPPVVQVMCMNCQHGKLMNAGVCPHQVTCNDYPGREYGQVAGNATPLRSRRVKT